MLGLYIRVNLLPKLGPVRLGANPRAWTGSQPFQEHLFQPLFVLNLLLIVPNERADVLARGAVTLLIGAPLYIFLHGVGKRNVHA